VLDGQTAVSISPFSGNLEILELDGV